MAEAGRSWGRMSYVRTIVYLVGSLLAHTSTASTLYYYSRVL